MTLHTKIRWNINIKTKQVNLLTEFPKSLWFLVLGDDISTYNKFLLYKQILQAIMMYDSQVSDCAVKCNIEVMQWF